MPLRAQWDAEAGPPRPPASAHVADYDYAAFLAHQVVPWAQLSPKERATMASTILLKVCVIIGALYFFICSLSFLADGFRLVGGKGVNRHVGQRQRTLGGAAPQLGSPASSDGSAGRRAALRTQEQSPGHSDLQQISTRSPLRSPPDLHQISTQISTRSPPELHQSSTRSPPELHQISTRSA